MGKFGNYKHQRLHKLKVGSKNKGDWLINISKQDKAGVMTKAPEPHDSFYSYEISQQG